MQLQSFKAFTNTAPVQPKIIGAYADNTVTNFPLGLVNVDGYAAAAGWLQIFDQAASPVNPNVPLKSINVAAAGPIPSIFGELGDIQINTALWFAMSSTEATYTAVATNFDVWGEIAAHELPLFGLSTTNGVNTLQAWAQASGPKTLYRVDVTNVAGAATKRWLWGFADDAAALKPFFVAPMFTYDSAGAVVNIASPSFNFGESGIIPEAMTTKGAIVQGCNFLISSTGPTTVGVTLNSYNASVVGSLSVNTVGDASTITAYYK